MQLARWNNIFLSQRMCYWCKMKMGTLQFSMRCPFRLMCKRFSFKILNYCRGNNGNCFVAKRDNNNKRTEE